MMNKIAEVRRANGEVATINFVEFGSGKVVVNTTPHPINMQDTDEELVTVPVSVLINASVIETEVVPSFVRSEFIGSDEGRETIGMIEDIFDQEYPEAKTDGKQLVIIGSIIAAQAYPGKVFGMTPVPGYERVAPSEKRMRCDKFTTFEKEGDKRSKINKLLDELDIMKSRDTSWESIPIWDAFDELKQLLK